MTKVPEARRGFVVARADPGFRGWQHPRETSPRRGLPGDRPYLRRGLGRPSPGGAYRLRGARRCDGGSIPEGRSRDISVGRQADYLLAWLKTIGIERAVFAGHDLGGGVVQIAAVRQPATCAGLLLTNAIGYDSWPIPSVKVMRALGAFVQHLPDATFKGVFGTVIKRGHDDPERASESIRTHWQHYARHDGAAAFVRQIRALNVHDTLSVAEPLRALKIPARIVWGANDAFQKVRYGERFARDLDAPLVRIEQGKHFTPEDHPETIAAEVKRLLDDVQRSERHRAANPDTAAGG